MFADLLLTSLLLDRIPSGTHNTSMTNELIPSDYQTFLQTIKSHIQQGQLQAVLAVNRELILLYRQIGRSILERQQQQGWGAKVIDTLAHDLHTTFPQMKGFSSRNLKYMRAFALTYPDEAFVQGVLHKLAAYQFTTSLPDALKDQLPGIEELEAGLKDIVDEDDQ